MTASVSASVAKGKALGDFQKECMLLSKLDHPNILKFMGACFSPSAKKEEYPYTALLTEFAENGSLADVIYSATGVKLSFNRKMKILEEIVNGMTYLHDRPEPILHLDIKPQNILLDSYFHARIADFGMSRIANPQFMASTLGNFVGGTPLYMAPEVMPRETVSEFMVSSKSDVYSFGILVNEMILEDVPYHDNRELVGEKKKTFEQLIKVVTSGEAPGVNRPTIVKDNHPLNQMVLATWATNPEQRKSFKQFAEEKPWEAASIFYFNAGTPKTDIITKKFEGKAEMPYKDWVNEIADLFNVKPILQVTDDCHTRALNGLLRIGNAASDNISAADSTLFLRWVADVATTDNELTCVIYGTVLEQWFWGKFSGDEAHTLLSNPVNNNKPGNFLVRWDGGWVLSYIAKNEEKKLEVIHEPLDSKIITLKQLRLAVTDKKYQKKAKTPATPHIFDAVRIKEKYITSGDGCYVTSDKKSEYRTKNYVYLM
uniref:Protein kinase domain-containing protein n=1 Tax=Arcella intermedia TaxID=1963864 RepID=A0A6B2L1Q4_9EUKA